MDYSFILQDSQKSQILARILAHLMGDGCVTNKYFAYYNKEEFLLEKFERDLCTLFGKLHIIKGQVNSGTFFRMICNKDIRLFFLSIVDNFKSNYLRLPLFINSKELQKEFLKSFYDDEGCVALRIFTKTGEIKRNLTLSSNSLFLLQEIKEILKLNFNITSNRIIKSLRKRNGREFVNYVLSITGKSNFERFRDLIGFYHPSKIERLNKMISSYIRK